MKNEEFMIRKLTVEDDLKVGIKNFTISLIID